MVTRRSGLGRGLDALIPTTDAGEGFAMIPLDHVDANPQQPRAHFDDEALTGLAESIREIGVLQPVVVRSVGEGRYELVAGERRCRAARLAGLSDIPAVIRGDATASTTLTEALIENVQREDLTPLEEAAGYRQLIDDFHLTHEAVASAMGRSRSAITNTLRLLQLPPGIQSLLERGAIAAGHARALLPLEDHAYATHIAERASEEGWSVRHVEDAVRVRMESGNRTSTPRKLGTVRPAAIIELETRLAEHLGAKVAIDYGGKGGKVVVKFGSLDDLERIYKVLSS